MVTDEYGTPQPAGFSYEEVQEIALSARETWRREQLKIWDTDMTTQITTDMARHVLLNAEAIRAEQVFERHPVDLHECFDSSEWAHAWMVTQRDNPGMRAEYDTVLAWFANALVSGFDEGYRYANKNAKVKDG